MIEKSVVKAGVLKIVGKKERGVEDENHCVEEHDSANPKSF